MPRRIVTPENLSRDFLIEVEREDGPVGLNLDPSHFQRDPETGAIRVIGGGGEGGGAVQVSMDGVAVHVAPSDINFVGAAVVDDGDGTVTVTVEPGGAGSSVSNGGVLVLPAPTDINFVGATVTDDEDGTVTVTVEAVPISASMGGAIVHIAPFDFNFVGLNVADDGDGSVTIVLESIGTGPVVRSRRPITLEGVSTTVAAAEEGHALHFSNAVDATLTIPTNAVAAIPIGAEMELVRMGAGPLNITAAAGVVLNGVDGGTTRIVFRYGGAVIRKIAINTWLVMGAIEEVTGDLIEPEVPLPTFLWADVFADHRTTPVYGENAAGLNWLGHGTTTAQPAEVALEWFMQNVVANVAPDGAIIDLTSPTGTMHLRGRMQPPPTSVARNMTLDLTGNTIERGKGADYWGQLFVWGEKANDPAMESAATIGADSAIGDTVLYLNDPDPDTEALLAVAVPGSIIEIRTNTTRKNYHPDESRTICFVASTNPTLKTITVMEPLLIDVPEHNPVGSWETSDPSTVTLLQGSLLSANAAAGSHTIVMASAAGLAVGDWLVIGTDELPGYMNNQFMDFIPDVNQIGPDLDITHPADYGDTLIQINEELHQIAAITGSTITLVGALGKNKLTAWKAHAFKVDPIENFTVIGGNFVGQQAHAGAAAWDHQYIWCRFMVNSLIRDANFDTNPGKGTTFRRTGQAVRFDLGHGNVMDNLNIGRPGDISAGNGYGVSFRRGERHSVIRNSYIEGARHSIEFWSSGGGCVAEYNHCADDCSSSIDTHGNWNTGIIIRHNLITRNAASSTIAPDSDSDPDAIRIGNNKFIFDENVQVLMNRVIGYDGNALSIVPGCWDITVDGLEVDGCYRILNFKGNTRHINTFNRDIVVRNVQADNIKDRILDIRHNSHAGTRMQVKGMVLENWTIGANGPVADHANVFDESVSGFQILHVEDLVLRNWTITNMNLIDEWCWFIESCEGIEFDNVSMDCLAGADVNKGMYLKNCHGLTGDITITGLEPEVGESAPTLLYFPDSGTNTASTTPTLTIHHDLGPTPKINPVGGLSTFVVTLVNDA